GVQLPYGLLFDQVVEPVYTRSSEGRALRAWEFDSPLGHFRRMGKCSAGPHKPRRQVRVLDPVLCEHDTCLRCVLTSRARSASKCTNWPSTQTGKAARSRAW